MQFPNLAVTAEATADAECIGRFRFNLPEMLLVVGRSQSIYRVDVTTIPVPDGGIQALWDSQLKKIHPGPQSSDSRDFRTFDLQPGTRAVWYIANPTSPHIRTLEAMRPVDTHAVLAVRSGEAGKEGNVETLVRNVLNAYLPVVTQGFCVGSGSITSEPGLNEQTLISLQHKALQRFKIRFETRTVVTPDTQTYSDTEEEKELASDAGGKMSVLRDHSRAVATLEGKEIWISVYPPGENPFLRFTWHFPGVPENSSKPMINIVGTAPVNNQIDLEKIWESLLVSVQAVPPSPQPK